MILNKLSKLYSKLFESEQFEIDDNITYVSYFESILNNQINSIILFDSEFKILAYNRKIESDVRRIRNIQLKIGESVLSLIAENNLEQFYKDVNQAISGQPVISERTVFDKDGKEYSFLYQYNPIKINNKILGVAMSTLEVTDLKIVNRMLVNNDLKYRSLIDSTQIALFHTRPDGIILDANLSACEMFGYTMSEFKNMNRSVIIDETDENLKKLLHERKVKGITSGRITGIRRGGVKFPIDICSVVYVDEITKEARTSTLAFDVTERIRNEKYLLETNQIAEVGGWEYDVVANKIYWSSITKKIYGYDEKFMPDVQVGIKHYTDGYSRDTITQLFNDAVNEGKEYEAELKLRRVNGEEIWIKTLGKVDIVNGKVVRVYGTFQNIDKAKKIELLLERSRQEYQSLYTQHPDAVFTLDLDGNIVDLNNNTLSLFNTDLNSIKKYKYIPFYLEDEADLIKTNFEKAITKEPIRFEVDVLTVSKKHIMLTYVPIVVDSETVGVYGLAKNITIQKEAEETLKFHSHLLNTIHQAVIVTDLEGTIIYWNNHAQHLYKYSYDEVIGKKILDVTVSEMSKSQAEEIIEQISNGHSWSGQFMTTDKDGNHFMVMVHNSPLYNKNEELIGIIGVSWDLSSEIATRNKISFQSNLLDCVEQAVIATDLKGVVYYWNNYAEKLYGIKKDEAIGLKTMDLIQIDAKKSGILETELVNIFRAGQSWKGELYVKSKNSDYFPIYTTNSPVYDHGNQLTGIITVSYDISVRKKNEIELIDSKNKIEYSLSELNHQKFALDQHSIVAVTDDKGTIIYVNDKFCEISGYERHELIGQNHRIINSGYHDKTFFKELYDTIYSGEVWNGEIRNKRKDGTYYWVRTTIVPFNDTQTQKPIQFIAIRTDITQQKEILKELEDINERYEYVTKATSDAIWDWNILTDEIFQGEGFFSLFGYVNTSKKLYFSETSKYIHKDDYVNVVNSLQKALNSSLNVWSAEYRYLKSNGEYAYVIDKAVIIRDSMNNAIRLIGAMQDVTKAKKEEQQLKLLESVITNSTDAVLITEAEPVSTPGPKIVYVNEAFTQMTGYSKEEVIGKSPRLLQGPNSDRNELDKLKKALLNWETSEIETINYKKSGEEFWVNFTVVPIADANGWYTHWIAIERDVTERKKAEEEKLKLISELTASNKELKQFSYITSHNLRAPVANLLGIFNILDVSEIKEELTLQLIDGLKASTLKLNETLNDLIKILVVKENTNLPENEILLEYTLSNVCNSIDSLIHNSKTQIITDFSEADTVIFNKSYLESIFLNMITNSIRYAKPGVNPVVKISSKIKAGKKQLIFEDNGLGMNMDRVRNEIFGLYKRFHNHSESKGIGLYLVHSQITALGGTIDVDSEVGVGTKFTITFK